MLCERGGAAPLTLPGTLCIWRLDRNCRNPYSILFGLCIKSSTMQNLICKSVHYNYDYYKAIGDYAFDEHEDISKFHISKLTHLSYLLSRCSPKPLSPSPKSPVVLLLKLDASCSALPRYHTTSTHLYHRHGRVRSSLDTSLQKPSSSIPGFQHQT